MTPLTGFILGLLVGLVVCLIEGYWCYRWGYEAGREHELDKNAQRLIRESRISVFGPRESMMKVVEPFCDDSETTQEFKDRLRSG